MFEGTLDWQRIVDFGSGTDNFVFLGMSTGKSIRGSMKNNGGSEEKLTGSNMANVNHWVHVAMTQEGNERILYVNGVEADSVTSNYSIAEIGAATQNYIGRSQYEADPYFNGRLDELIFAKRAFSAEEIKDLATIKVTEEMIKDKLELANAASVKESLPLASEVYGYEVKWESSDEEIVNPNPVQNGEYVIPAGLVKRDNEEHIVTLKATVDFDGKEVVKEIPLYIEPLPKEEEMEGYVYSYFRSATNGAPERLKIHLAASEDALNWIDLNGNFPVLASDKGTRCVRDPYFIRSKNGDRVYLLATDLNTQDGQGWQPWSRSGSKYLIVWESDDMVNWSEPRMIKFADENIGCAWAPEAIYDETTDEYLVYASGKDLDGSTIIDTVYVVRTRDFRTFSEPETFIGGDGNGYIDSTVIKAHDGRYYRFTKKWSKIIMDVADNASGPYTQIPRFQLGDKMATEISNVEGPGIFRFHDTVDEYCLMIDDYGSGAGFTPYITKDIASGKFEKAVCNMPTGSKHGGVLALKKSEYEAVLEKWGSPAPDEAGSDARYIWDFETEESFGGAELAYNEEIDSNVLKFSNDGKSFELPENIVDRRDYLTFAFDVKATGDGEKVLLNIEGVDNSYYKFSIGDNILKAGIATGGEKYEQSVETTFSGSLKDDWMRINLVIEPERIAIYKNGVKVSERENISRTISHLGLENLNVSIGQEFEGEIDNVALYYRALSDEEILESYDITDEKAVLEDLSLIDLGYPEDDVRGNVTLITAGAYGSKITWKSSNEHIISETGKVTLPQKGDNERQVTLTATAVKGEAEAERVFKVIVREEKVDRVSTANWNAYDFERVTKDAVFMYDVCATQLTDGVMGFASKDATPSKWSSFNMVVRLTKDGKFDARNGAAFESTNNVYYEAGKSYRVIVKVNVEDKKYSVYVYDGKRISLVADNFDFRSDAPETNNIGKITVRGGDGMKAGLFTVSDFGVYSADIFFDYVIEEEGLLKANIVSVSDMKGNILVAAYSDEVLTSVEIETMELHAGANTYERAIPVGEKIKLMIWNSKQGMEPCSSCRLKLQD